jgi:Ca-activated chloride channel family protein
VSFSAPTNAPAPPPALVPGGFGALDRPISVEDFAKANQTKPGDLDDNRGKYADKDISKNGEEKGEVGKAFRDAKAKKDAYEQARELLRQHQQDGVQAGKLGVDLSLQTSNLRNQARLDQAALKNVYGRNCLEFGGVWIDEGFDAKMQTLTIKAQSDAYFKLLERHPKIKDVLTLGNHLVWVAPNGTALIIDAGAGKETATDDEIDALFTAKK